MLAFVCLFALQDAELRLRAGPVHHCPLFPALCSVEGCTITATSDGVPVSLGLISMLWSQSITQQRSNESERWCSCALALSGGVCDLSKAGCMTYYHN